MNNGEVATAILVHFSFASSVVMMIAAFRKHQRSFLQLAFCALVLTLGVWNFGTMMELDYRLITGETVDSAVSIMLIDLCYLAICFNPIFIFFVGRSIGYPDWRPGFQHLALFIIPVISFMMVCTNPLHHLFFKHFSLYSSEAVYGPYYYFHSLYSYGFVFAGLIYITRFAFRSSGVLSKQFFLVLIGVLVPLAGNMLFSFGIVDLSFSVNACLFTVSIICFFVAVFKYQLITVAPISMRQVIDLVSDGFLQTDSKMQIVDYNNTLLGFFPNTTLIRSGTTINDFFSQGEFAADSGGYIALFNQTISSRASATITIGRTDLQPLTMMITPFFNDEGYTGSIMIFKRVEESGAASAAKLQSALMEAEEERQARQSLFDSNPHINFVVDISHEVIDCNPSALKFYQFDNKADFKRDLLQTIIQATPELLPDGEPTVPATQRFADAIAHGETSFDTVLLFDGEEIPFHFDLKMVPYKGAKVIAVYQTDLRTLRQVEKDLERRDRLLSSINQVASRLISLEDQDFDKVFGESIAMLGRSIDVQRVVVWKNFERDGELYCTQLHEWCENAEVQHGKAHTINVKYADVVPTWERTLCRGECVNSITRDLLPSEQEQMERQGIKSVLAVPLFVKDLFWGFVGFDDCVNERLFSEMEEKTLGSGAMLIAAALFRNEITNDLILAKEDALSSARAKGAFLANMSHEIRTPLNAIVGMANIARRKAVNDEAINAVDEILRASRHLMELINDILDFSKIESGKMDIVNEPFSLHAAMREVESLIAHRCAEKSIVFETNLVELEDVAVSGDKLRIKQVIINLLGNAVKFTDERGVVAFMINILEQSASDIALQFLVRDSGIGISPEQIPNLFTAFEQGDRSISIKYKGTGLGLAISQKIINAMGGRIVVESLLGKGSVFHFTIKLSKADLPALLPHMEISTEKLSLLGKRILVAEDIEINSIILVELLADTQVEIDVAVDGVHALQLFERSAVGAYDLIFMDIQMPNMDGYQATRAIRELDRPDAKAVPIVAMTANAYREDIERAMAAGMDDHIAKPIDIDLVKQLLRERIGG